MTPRLLNNHDFITLALSQYNARAETNYPQYLCFYLKLHLKKSKHFDRLTDDLLVSKTLQVLSGDYDPEEPVDFFLYPQGEAYEYPPNYTLADVLTTDFYYIFNHRREGRRETLILHDKATDTYTQVRTEPHEVVLLDKDRAQSILDYESDMVYVQLLELTRNHTQFLLECGIILKNFDKKAKAIKIDPKYEPVPYTPPETHPLPESTVEYVDDLDDPDDDLDDLDPPADIVTDELIKELDAAVALEDIEFSGLDLEFSELDLELYP